MYGVLRSSGSYRGALQRKEGDVVLLLPALPHEGVELLHQRGAQVRSAHRMLAQEIPKARVSKHLTVGVMRFYEPVGVQENSLSRFEDSLFLFVAHLRHKTQRHPSRAKICGCIFAAAAGEAVSSVGVEELSTLGIEDGIEASDEHVRSDACQQRLVHSR